MALGWQIQCLSRDLECLIPVQRKGITFNSENISYYRLTGLLMKTNASSPEIICLKTNQNFTCQVKKYQDSVLTYRSNIFSSFVENINDFKII